LSTHLRLGLLLSRISIEITRCCHLSGLPRHWKKSVKLSYPVVVTLTELRHSKSEITGSNTGLRLDERPRFQELKLRFDRFRSFAGSEVSWQTWREYALSIYQTTLRHKSKDHSMSQWMSNR
jgi:hypothetical protein